MRRSPADEAAKAALAADLPCVGQDCANVEAGHKDQSAHVRVFDAYLLKLTKHVLPAKVQLRQGARAENARASSGLSFACVAMVGAEPSGRAGQTAPNRRREHVPHSGLASVVYSRLVALGPGPFLACWPMPPGAYWWYYLSGAVGKLHRLFRSVAAIIFQRGGPCQGGRLFA